MTANAPGTKPVHPGMGWLFPIHCPEISHLDLALFSSGEPDLISIVTPLNVGEA